MGMIINVLLIIGALFGLWFANSILYLPDFEETKAWLQLKFGKDRKEPWNTPMFDWDCEIIMRHLIFIVCEGIILYTIINSIIYWNCFSILRLFISLVGVINTLLIFFQTDSEKIDLIDFEFQNYGASMIAYAWGLIIALYTLLFYFRVYIMTSVIWIILATILQFVCWLIFFYLLIKVRKIIKKYYLWNMEIFKISESKKQR